MPVWDEGEVGHGTEQEWELKSRTATGQIRGIDEANGKLIVELIGSREKYEVDAPVFGLSANGINSSWARHMPQVRDFVDITFTPDNRPRLVRVTTWNPTSNAGGYAAISAAATNNIGNLGLIWRKLSQGEFDMRSSGGAGYYFTNDGHAILQGGPTTIELDKNRYESFGNAGLWVRRGGGVEVRYGDVKRLLPGTFAETSVSPTGLPLNPTAAGAKEWSRSLTAQPAPGVTLSLEDEVVGDVRDALGVPVPGGFGVPLRSRRRWYGADGLATILTFEVDAVGNVSVEQAATAVAGGVDLSMPTNPFSIETLSFVVSGTASGKVDGGAKLDLTGVLVNVNAGGTADSSMVRGDQLAIYFATKLSVLTAFGPSGPAIVPLAPGAELSLAAKVK